MGTRRADKHAFQQRFNDLAFSPPLHQKIGRGPTSFPSLVTYLPPSIHHADAPVDVLHHLDPLGLELTAGQG